MKMIIANFKSNKTRDEYEQWMNDFEKYSSTLPESLRIILAPPHPDLMFISNRLLTHELHRNTSLAVQDISSYPAGSYTGAVSTHTLQGFNVKYAIVGHSERRKYFHETVTDVANKVRECLVAHITPIVCVTKDEINAQANLLDANERVRCMVAFEPVDHIGTGESDTLEHILETKKWVQTAFGNVPYIYGGSVNPSTTSTILNSSEINGFLVGTASLDVTVFQDLLKKFEI